MGTYIVGNCDFFLVQKAGRMSDIWGTN